MTSMIGLITYEQVLEMMCGHWALSLNAILCRVRDAGSLRGSRPKTFRIECKFNPFLFAWEKGAAGSMPESLGLSVGPIFVSAWVKYWKLGLNLSAFDQFSDVTIATLVIMSAPSYLAIFSKI